MAFSGLSAFSSPDPGLAVAGGLTTLNLSLNSDTDPNSLKHGDTDLSLGTIVVATNQGRMSVPDGWISAQNIGARPVGKLALYAILKATPPTTDPGSGHCYLGLYVGRSMTLTAGEGYTNSLCRKSTNTSHIGRPKRIGADTTINTIFVGEGESHLLVPFSGNVAAAGFGFGAGATSGYDEGSETTNSGGVYTDIFLGFYAVQTHSTPNLQTWTGVSVSYEWR